MGVSRGCKGCFGGLPQVFHGHLMGVMGVLRMVKKYFKEFLYGVSIVFFRSASSSITLKVFRGCSMVK